MKCNPDKIERLCSQTTRKMGFFNKADIIVLVEGNVEWISVKKFTASFNQIDKKWTDTLCQTVEDIRGNNARIQKVLWRAKVQTKRSAG